MQENAGVHKWSDAKNEMDDEEKEKIQNMNNELDDIIKGWRQKADHIPNECVGIEKRTESISKEVSENSQEPSKESEYHTRSTQPLGAAEEK